MLLLLLRHLYCRPCLLYFCRLLLRVCNMICRTTSLYEKNRTTILYDFYRSSDISLIGRDLRAKMPTPPHGQPCLTLLPPFIADVHTDTISESYVVKYTKFIII